MNYIENILLLLVCGHSLFTHTMRIDTNQKARDYCALDKKSYVAIVWPITPQKNDSKIELLFNKYGKIKYKTQLLMDPVLAYTLLYKAHPFIIDFPEHIRWYFPGESFKKPARIYVVHFEDLTTAVACKYSIRKLCNLQYRAVHINDTHEETVEFAHLLFK